jgi:2-oxoglutarate ferredoxin oxidoreductase subunit beta
MNEALRRKGFTFIEVISQCPTLFGRRNRLGSGLDEMKLYKQRSKISHAADTKEVGIGLEGEITVGKFVDTDQPTFHEQQEKHLRERLGSRYVPYRGIK